MKYSKHFCLYPWITSMVYTNSMHHYCCISNDGEIRNTKTNEPLSVKDCTISEVRNSDFMRKMRHDMVDGKPIIGCEVCIEQERWGKKSYRQIFNQEWRQFLGEAYCKKIVQNSISHNFEVNTPLHYLDLRLGNLCNLKCRMCNPINSSGWAQDYKKLCEHHSDFLDVSNYAFGPGLEIFAKKEYNQWLNNEAFWSEIYSFLPHLKKLYLTGGEPTLIKQNTELLKRIIALNRQDKICIFFNTNATNISDEFLSLIKKFSTPLINISIDGFGDTNDYIRYPSKWENVSQNIERIANIPQVVMNLTPVLQIYNLFSIGGVFQFADQLCQKLNRKIGIDTLYNIHPYHLDIRILPNEIRKEAFLHIKNLQTKLSKDFQKDYLVRNSLKGMQGIYHEDQLKESKLYLDQFLKYTDVLDKTRNQNFTDVCPELSQLFQRG